MGMSADNIHGLILALSSSIFIGCSFIIKKKGLKRAGKSGVRAASGGHAYLKEPWWWAGMISMIVGEIANFAAYAFAPAILVTPLGALSIIFSAILAHFILKEKLYIFGILGCALCVVGSVTIVLHAPQEKQIESVKHVWGLATEPGFLGASHMIVYVGICSLMGSLTVYSLNFINYLNKALDTFNTAVISPTYYVMFTTFTILASIIMFKDWASQNASQIAMELCGFVTILSGTFQLHRTQNMGSDKPASPVHPSLETRANSIPR